MIDTIRSLYPLNRCLVSSGQDKALEWINKRVSAKNSRLYKIPSGKKVFTWTVPQRWEHKLTTLTDLTDSKQLFTGTKQRLHTVTGSLPFSGIISFEELHKHLHYRKDYPRAIPYVMKYYGKRDWGLSVSYNQYLKLNRKHKFKVAIESEWTDGQLKILEVTIPGKIRDEIHILAHVDHPFQANDNLSGVAVALQLYQEMKSQSPNHTIKFIFHTETIGTIAYLSKRQKDFKIIKGAIVLDIVGNRNTFLYQNSFKEESSVDFATEYVFRKNLKKFRVAKFQEIMGSDELTYNDPKIGIPGVLISTYPFKEYHTHLDSPKIIDTAQLKTAKALTLEILTLLDLDFVPERNYTGPLLRRPIGWFLDSMEENMKLDLFQYRMDGEKSVLQISGEIGLDLTLALKFAKELLDRRLVL